VAGADYAHHTFNRLSHDLQAAFPGSRGFSPRNLRYMRTFAQSWPDEVWQQPAAELPWGHVMVLLDKLDDQAERDWYATAAAEHGWSRNVLLNQIMNRLHTRAGAAPSNFPTQLPTADSELAQQLTRDPYILDFLDLTGPVAERDLETALMNRLQDFLLELGHGFAFVGRQYHVAVDGDDFHIDLLFFIIWLSLMRVLHVHDARRGVRIAAWLTGILVMSSTRRLIRCRSSRSGLRLPGGAPSLCSGRTIFRSRRSSRSWPTLTT